MRTGRRSPEPFRRFVTVLLVALSLVSEGRATATVTLAAPPGGDPAAQISSSPEAQEEALDRVFEEALPSIFLVETETWTGVGFLADPSGLIVTAIPAARSAHYLAVTLVPGRKVAARPVDGSVSPYGIIQVNPEAVAGLRPLPIAGPPNAANPEAEGDPLVGIFLSPEGGFVRQMGAITKGGGLCPRANLPLPPEPGSCGYSPACMCWPVQCATGLVLDSRGGVIGLNPFKDNKRRPNTRIVRMRNGAETLAAARAKAEQTPPPAPTFLPTAPSGPYPRGAPDPQSAVRPDLGLYQTQAGPFLVELLTPALARAEEERMGGKETDQEGTCSQPKGDRNRWRPGFADESPVVTLRVIPEIRRRAGTYVGVAVFWVFSPVLFIGSLGPSSTGPPEVPHVSSRFDPAIRELELLRAEKKVEPIRPERVCGDRGALLNVDLCPPESQQREGRRVKGCYLNYRFPAEAFAPGELMELRIYTEKSGESAPLVVNLDDALLQRIHSEFQPRLEGE